MSKLITLYSHASGPNPWKVAIVLEELGLKYETKFLDFAKDVKAKPFIDKNPNGRVPCIEDPNTGITIWESGAIILYLVDEYDTQSKISIKSKPEKYLLQQWLMFQVSGQGPYFGQAAWFAMFHHEDVPSAKERYKNEAKRVTKVLNDFLADKEYLVGNKCTYADLSFVTWASMFPLFFGGQLDIKGEFPHYNAWMERLMARPAVKKVMDEKKAANSQ